MSNKKRIVGAEPRCDKTVMIEKINEIVKHSGYSNYFDKHSVSKKAFERRSMNCSDTAPHQKEIEILSRAGFSPEAINAILALHYAHELDVEKVADNVKVRLKKRD